MTLSNNYIAHDYYSFIIDESYESISEKEFDILQKYINLNVITKIGDYYCLNNSKKNNSKSYFESHIIIKDSAKNNTSLYPKSYIIDITENEYGSIYKLTLDELNLLKNLSSKKTIIFKYVQHGLLSSNK